MRKRRHREEKEVARCYLCSKLGLSEEPLALSHQGMSLPQCLNWAMPFSHLWGWRRGWHLLSQTSSKTEWGLVTLVAFALCISAGPPGRGQGAACPLRGTEAPLPLPSPLPLPCWLSRSLPAPPTHKGCRLKTAGDKNSCADEAERGPEHMKGLGLGWQRWRDPGIPQPHEHLPMEPWGCPGLFLPLQSWGPPGMPPGTHCP